MKPSSPAFSVPQAKDVMEILEREAANIDCSLTLVQNIMGRPNWRKLGPPELENLSLAIHVANTYLSYLGKNLEDNDICAGINEYQWPGRFQLIVRGPSRLYLDIAHNEISIPVALAWFSQAAREYELVAGRQLRVLIFGSPAGRDATKLMDLILQFCNDENFYFDQVILTSYVRRVDGTMTFDPEAARLHETSWKTTNNSPVVKTTKSVQEALDFAQQEGSMQTLIFGSSHLISNVYSRLFPSGFVDQ
ncbi:hypothetical protein F5Y01DRAFT_318981 [Xylaria sp. FL0043]|nr:hypothetical protein F5Y01DRAFT_318981 [Xylaria sp. FL0043]